VRQPKSLYENCRSHTLLKVKHFHSEEAKVTGHEKGSGRCQNMCGKIHCVLPNGVAFKIGEWGRAAPPVPQLGTCGSVNTPNGPRQRHQALSLRVRQRGVTVREPTPIA